MILLVGLLAAVLWLSAPTFAKLGISAAFRWAGLPPVDFRVEEVAVGRLQLSEIRLDSGELEAAGLTLQWSWSDLRMGRVDSVTIEGLSVQAHLDETGVSFGALDPWLRPSDSNRGAGLFIPANQLTLRAATLALDTPAGSQRAIANADLRLHPTRNGVVSINWRAAEKIAGSLQLRLDDPGSIRAELLLDVDRDALAPWVPDLADAWPTALVASIRGEADLAAPPSIDAGQMPSIAGGTWQLEATVRDLELGGERIPTVELAASATLDGERIRFDTQRVVLQRGEGEPWDAAISVEGRMNAGDAVVDRFALALPALPLIGRGGTIRATGSGRTSATAADATFELDAELDDGANALTRLRGPMRVHWEPDALLVTLPSCLEVGLATGPLTPNLRLERGAEGCVRTGDDAPIRVELPLADAPRFSAGLTFSAPALFLRTAARRDPLRLGGRSIEIALDVIGGPDGVRGTLTLRGDSLDLPRSGLLVRQPGIEGEWSLTDGPSFEGTFSVGTLVDSRRPTRIPPLLGSGQFDATPDRIQFDARASDQTDSLRARIQGVHAFESGIGHANFASEPMLFGEGRATAKAVERWLGQTIRIEAGTLGAVARVGWNPNASATRAEFALAEADLTGPGITVHGTQGTLRLKELAPATTDGPQELRFQRISAGLPFGAGHVVYTIEPARIVRIRESEIELAGGRIEISGVVDLTGGPEQRLDFRVADVDLPKLLSLVPVSGLEATGTLSGEMQLAVVDGRPVLRGGVFRALEGGRIQYRPNGSSETPAAKNDPTAMVRQMMGDFHYEVLNLSVAGWLDERAFAQAKLRGYNPSFQNGHPVNLTLNLSSAFEQAVAVIPELQALFRRLANPRVRAPE